MPKKDYQKWSQNELIDEIRSLQRRKKYGMVWEDKPEDVVERCKTELPVLEEKRTKAISNGDGPTNILIEGDNFHALSVLNYTHKGKIDVIYIDPPYNTGARDWKYNNDYVDINDVFRHSKWLSMMNHRLVVAKKLLKPDGVLILTIDDNELFHIGTLLEEIFPKHDTFIVTIEHNKRGRRGKNFAKSNEWALFLVPKGLDVIAEEKSDGIIGGETRNLRRTGSGSKRTDRPRKFYPIWVNEKTLEVISAGDPLPVDAEWEVTKKDGLITIWPIDEDGREKNWHYGVERTRACIADGVLEARVRDYGIQVYYTLREKDSKKYKTVWSKPIYDASTYGSVLLEEILGQPSSFDYPKSLHAVVECLKAAAGKKKNATVLDFFAGSGTTGHAVLELNKIDGGNRSFILCTNNENNIAEEVTLPRLRNVINGYDFSGTERTVLFDQTISLKAFEESDFILEQIERLKEKHSANYDRLETKIEDSSIRLIGITRSSGKKEGLGGNLKYFTTGFVSADPTDKNKRHLTKKATDMLCLKENTFEETYSDDFYAIYSKGNRHTAIIFDHLAIDDFKNRIRALDGKFSVYVFSLGDDTFDEEFEDVASRVRLSPIPEAILRVYRRIFG